MLVDEGASFICTGESYDFEAVIFEVIDQHIAQKLFVLSDQYSTCHSRLNSILLVQRTLDGVWEFPLYDKE